MKLHEGFFESPAKKQGPVIHNGRLRAEYIDKLTKLLSLSENDWNFINVNMDGCISINDEDNLRKICWNCISQYGNHVSLNWIDVSGITEMRLVFYGKSFYGDISRWDVSHVTDMQCLFCDSNINCDISGWDVHNLIHMDSILANNKVFNCDISNWDVRNVQTAKCAFANCGYLNIDFSKWKMPNIVEYDAMFGGCRIRPEQMPRGIEYEKTQYKNEGKFF